MKHAIAALVLQLCSAFMQPQATRRDVALRAKPKVVVFDLDGCLWDPEMFMLSWRGGAPFTPDGDAMLAQSGERVVLLGAAREILRELRTTDDWSATKVAISSRTDEPAWAAELLDKFRVDDMVLGDCFDAREITKESKSSHFRRLKERYACDYEDILFFDNEYGNCREISSLGVTVAFSPEGVTGDVWAEALAAFPADSIVNDYG
jgi:magnesium-dependent phosphatase 1